MGKHTRLKDRILRERGLELSGGLVVRSRRRGVEEGKTPLMALLEARYGLEVKDLIRRGKVRDVARRLGIHYSLVSKWRKRFGINGE